MSLRRVSLIHIMRYQSTRGFQIGGLCEEGVGVAIDEFLQLSQTSSVEIIELLGTHIQRLVRYCT
jgi:hypothetical protein